MRYYKMKAIAIVLVITLLLTMAPFPAVALELSEDSLITGPITETPIDEGRPVEPALDWEYTNEAPRPHVIVEATTPTVGTLGTTEPSDISLNYTQVAADEGYSFELTATAQPGQSITWTSADPAVATVTPTGDNTALVTSLRAGETAITATLENGDVAVCTVYATVADGVYYIATNNLYLGVDGSLLEYTPMKLLEKQTTGPAKIRQLWKIHYYGSGSVSVRSLYKLDMGLYSSDANKVSITTVGTGVAVPNANRWTIVQEDAGYVFQHVGTSSKCMCAEAGSFAPQTKVVTAPYSANRTGIHWTLQEDTSVVSQVLLINTAHGLPAHNAVRYVMPGETMTLADMNLTASFVSRYTNAQNLQWLAIDDAHGGIVRVNSSTGSVTGVVAGQTTITVKAIFNGSSYTSTYTVIVLPFPDGTYYIRSRKYNRYMQASETSAPNYSTSGTIMEQWAFTGGTHQKWSLTALSNGYYKIISSKSGLALTVPSNEENICLIQEAYTGHSTQQWKITKTQDGSYKIKSRSAESQDRDLIMVAEGDTYNNLNGAAVLQLEYTNDADYRDQWMVFMSIDMGMSTDNYSGGDLELQSYRYANKFYEELIAPSNKGPITKIHKYNMGATNTASKKDFSENGAISNDIDFMIYLGHGHSAYNSKGNHILYSYSTNGISDPSDICANSAYDETQKDKFRMYTDDVHFGSEESDLRWVWMYTCNFLTPNAYVTETALKQMMTGAHIVMGYESQAYLCDPMASTFAEYLLGGMPIIDAYFKAGCMGEASATNDHHIQKILYIPQARYETIYSPPARYQYDATDVLIITHDIQDGYVG